MKQEYPKMLYKQPGKLKIDGEYYTTVVVKDEKERDVKLKEGFTLLPGQNVKPTRKRRAQKQDDLKVVKGAKE